MSGWQYAASELVRVVQQAAPVIVAVDEEAVVSLAVGPSGIGEGRALTAAVH